jgi:PAS domain S-box-containing protein
MIRLLLVDDEPLLLDLTRAYLEQSGDIMADTAGSAKEALDALRTASYDAVVSDYQMPGTDGITLLKEVRKTSGDLPFIIFTGRSREDVVIEALNNGVDFYLQKGGDPKSQFAELVHKVRRAVDRRRTEKALAESEQKLQSIIKGSPLPTFIVDQEHRIIFWNQALERLTGIPAETVIGTNRHWQAFFKTERPCLADLLVDRAKEEISRWYGRGQKRSHLWSEESDDRECCLYQDRQGRWLSITSALIRDDAGRIIGAMESIEDITAVREAEEALRSSEERLKVIFEYAPDAYYLHDLKGTFIDGNRAAEDLIGYRREDLIGRNCLRVNLAPPRQLPRIAALLAKNARGQSCGPEELVLVRRDGSQITVEIRTYPVTIGGQQLVLGIARDITARTRTERALRESRRELSTLMSNLPGMAYRCKNDRDWTMEFVSEGARDLIGYAPSEVVNNRLVFFGDLIHPDDRDMVWNTVQRALQEREPFKLIFRLTTARGEERWIWQQGRGIFNPEGEAIALEGLMINTTERKGAEDALRDANRTLNVLIDAIPDAISFKGADNRYRLVNTAFARFVGHSREEILGRSPHDLLPPELADYCDRIDHDMIESSELVRLEEHRIEFHGETRIYATTRVVIIGDDGCVTGIVCISRDITEAGRAEEALKQVNRKLNLLNSVTRHDVLNQLTVVLGFLHLAEESTTDPLLLEFLSKMDQAADMVRRQIAFTKEYQEIGVHSPRWQCVKRAFESVCSVAKTSGVRVIVDVNPALEIYADPLLEKVFLNLLDNACRYGERLSEVRVFCETSPGGLTIVCEDDGIGISSPEKERIFSRGYGKNTGFGLFLAREILSITGLAIRETGVPGNGARFEISVPSGAYQIGQKDDAPHRTTGEAVSSKGFDRMASEKR